MSGDRAMRLNQNQDGFQTGGSRWVSKPTRDDRNAGYWVSGADDRGDEYGALGSHYANRGFIATDYEDADADYARQQQARGDQMALGQQYQDVISGKAPSLAEMQMRQGQDDAAQSALNLAASARGGGALLAQQQAINANALGQQRVGQDAAMLRAQETSQARDAYGNLLNNVRGADLGSMGQRADMAQAQAGSRVAQRGQNDAMGAQYRGMRDSLQESQRDANISVWQGNQSAQTAVQTGSQQAAAADRASNRAALAGVVGAGLGAGASMYTGGKKGLPNGAHRRCPQPK